MMTLACSLSELVEWIQESSKRDDVLRCVWPPRHLLAIAESHVSHTHQCAVDICILKLASLKMLQLWLALQLLKYAKTMKEHLKGGSHRRKCA